MIKKLSKLKSRKTLCMSLAIGITISSVFSIPMIDNTPSVSASTLNANAKNSYYTLLADGTYLDHAHKHDSLVSTDRSEARWTKFSLYDVTGDNNQELILHDFHTDTTGGFGMIYSYNTESQKTAYYFAPHTIEGVGTQGRIMCSSFPYDTSGMGHYVEKEIYVFHNGKFTSTGYCIKDKTENGGKITYWKNGKKIKKSTFNYYTKKYKIKKCKTYYNTKKNREKYITL